MSNGIEIPKTNGGVGGLLTTLASGDNTIKALIIVGLIINTGLTKCNNTDIRSGNMLTEKARKQVIRKVDAIFNNQRVWADYMEERRTVDDKIMDKLGIEHQPHVPYPQKELEFPSDDDE